MPHYIKTGYWALEKNGYKGWLNLEDIIGGGGGSSAVSVTKAEIDTLITANSLVPGQTYIISGVDVPLYGGTTIVLQAETTNKLALAGHGIFYNPKYLNSQLTPNNGYGVWSNYINLVLSNIVGDFYYEEPITANNGATAIYLAKGLLQWVSGNWATATSITGDYGATANVSGGVSPSYAIGQNVIWGGKHWTNTSGNVGTAVNKYTLSGADWTAVAFNDVDYNVSIDLIHYDYSHDMIIRRKDKWDNDVDGNFQVFDEFSNPLGYYNHGNPIKDFQWGNGNEDYAPDGNNYYVGVQSNLVKDSYFECINFIGTYSWHNKLTQQSWIYNNIIDKYSSIGYNTLSAYSKIIDNKLSDAFIESNVLNLASFIDNNSFIGNFSVSFSKGSCYNNNLSNGYIVYNQIEGTVRNNNLFNSNIRDNYGTGSIVFNELSNDSSIQDNYFNNASSTIQYNKLSNLSIIRNNTLIGASNISRNQLQTASEIRYNALTDSDIGYNYLNSSSILHQGTLNSSAVQDIVFDNTFLDFSTSGTLTGKSITNISGQYANTSGINISAATIIYGNYPKQLIKRQDGTTKLGYYNNSDVFTVVNVNA